MDPSPPYRTRETSTGSYERVRERRLPTPRRPLAPKLCEAIEACMPCRGSGIKLLLPVRDRKHAETLNWTLLPNLLTGTCPCFSCAWWISPFHTMSLVQESSTHVQPRHSAILPWGDTQKRRPRWDLVSAFESFVIEDWNGSRWNFCHDNQHHLFTTEIRTLDKRKSAKMKGGALALQLKQKNNDMLQVPKIGKALQVDWHGLMILGKWMQMNLTFILNSQVL